MKCRLTAAFLMKYESLNGNNFTPGRPALMQGQQEP